MSPEFWITALVVTATPGTGVLFTVAAGLTRGSRASVVAALGCTLGIVPHMLAAVTGLAALLHTSAVAFSTLKYLGVAYLLYLAWATLREHGAMTIECGHSTPRSARQTIVSAILVNLLNPKLTIFFFAFLPQFVGDVSGSPMPHHTIREPWWHGHRLLKWRDPFTHLHVFGPDCPEVIRHLMFHDWLVEHPDDRERYAAAKSGAARAIASADATDSTGMDYNAYKQPVVRELYDRMFRARGLL